MGIRRKDQVFDQHEIVKCFSVDTFETLVDYDLPKDVTGKRMAKGMDRTRILNEQTFEYEENLATPVFITLGGGHSAFERRRCAVDIGRRSENDAQVAGYSIEFHDFWHGGHWDLAAIKELLHETLEPLPAGRLRYICGVFSPTQVWHLVRMGIDLFDTSFASKMADEAKAIRLAPDFAETSSFTLMDFTDDHAMDEERVKLDKRFDWVGPMDRLSKIRAIRLRQVTNETDLERQYRENREKLNRWCSAFWADHNTKFDREKAAYVDKRKSEIGRTEQVSAEDLSKFYKQFLDSRHQALMDFNSEWYRRNLGLIWPALQVNMIRLKRLLLRR
ncbi:unnamed protein product, partial [Mesorhabditis spiculigera]